MRGSANGSSPAFALRYANSVSRAIRGPGSALSGVSGTVVLAKGLEARGMPRPAVSAAVVVDPASYYAAYVVSLAAALLYASPHREGSWPIVLIATVFGLGGIGLSAAILGLSGRGARALPRALPHLRSVQTVLEFVAAADPHVTRSPRLLLQASAYQLAIIAVSLCAVCLIASVAFSPSRFARVSSSSISVSSWSQRLRASSDSR